MQIWEIEPDLGRDAVRSVEMEGLVTACHVTTAKSRLTGAFRVAFGWHSGQSLPVWLSMGVEGFGAVEGLVLSVS